MNKLFVQLLEKRHLGEDFIHPKYEDKTDPFTLPDMEKAVARLASAIKNREKILIYGDYDVDGVTASTLMEHALKLAGVSPDHLEIMLPDRFIDGYGMSPRLIKRAKDAKISLVITVDCGSRNHSIVEELNLAHIDTIITDHHECEDTLPSAIAVINPKRHDYTGPETLKNLAGVGVAFKLAEALVKSGHIKDGQEKWLLDLVLLGTICDQMLLTSENRILTYYGVKVLEKTRRKGLIELMKNAHVTKITSESIGFQIGPRLNAAGRLETAELSLNLLRTNSSTEAASLAAKLESLNKTRRDEQRSATDEIISRGAKPDPVIIETGHWHEGIIGIVAGRLVEKYHKPAFVLTEVEDGIYKGSARSFGDFNLASALEFAKSSILGGGGHAAAAGVQVAGKDLYAFREKINEYYNSLGLKNQEKYLKCAADLETANLKDISLELLDDLKLLEPYGAGNETPIFQITGARIFEVRRMGDKGQHLRLDLKGKDGQIIKCIAFSAPEHWFNLYEDENYDFIITPVENEFRGVRSAEARLLDVIPS
ncbi:single-stranded-DNA-specific exonuclease RecJ [Candidatus Saccharibacteria bacterium]|nr:single-stranded-DNA-specific exonuclease RecJ [Candidatus Saccharibacteria bacterium]